MITNNAKLSRLKYEHVVEYSKKLLSLLNPNLKYHSFEHTFNHVVPATFELTNKLDNETKNLAAIAGALHDIGFLFKYAGHEYESARMAKKYFLETTDSYTFDQVDIILSAIEKTNLGEKPVSLVDKIVRDSDLSYIARPDFMNQISNLMNESLLCKQDPLYSVALKGIGPWIDSSIKFFSMFGWNSSQAEELYGKRKVKNLEKMGQVLKLIDY